MICSKCKFYGTMNTVDGAPVCLYCLGVHKEPEPARRRRLADEIEAKRGVVEEVEFTLRLPGSRQVIARQMMYHVMEMPDSEIQRKYEEWREQTLQQITGEWAARRVER